MRIREELEMIVRNDLHRPGGRPEEENNEPSVRAPSTSLGSSTPNGRCSPPPAGRLSAPVVQYVEMVHGRNARGQQLAKGPNDAEGSQVPFGIVVLRAPKITGWDPGS